MKYRYIVIENLILVAIISLIVLSLYGRSANYSTLFIVTSIIVILKNVTEDIRGELILRFLCTIYIGYVLYSVYVGNYGIGIKVVIGIITISDICLCIKALIQGSYKRDILEKIDIKKGSYGRGIRNILRIRGKFNREDVLVWLSVMAIIVILWLFFKVMSIYFKSFRVDYILLTTTILTFYKLYSLGIRLLYMTSILMCMATIVNSVVHDEYYMVSILVLTVMYVISSFIKNYKLCCYIEDTGKSIER